MTVRWVRWVTALTASAVVSLLALQVHAQGQGQDEPQDKPPTTPPTPPTAAPDKADGGGGADDEIVEVLDDDANNKTQKKPSARPTPEPTKSDNKVEVRGFARATVALGLPAEGAAPRAAPREERVGYERASTVDQAYLDVRYSRGKGFQAVLSGSIAYTGVINEGNAGQRLDSREYNSVYIEPLLREAYLGFYTDRIDIRLGQQRIVWGNSDAVAPNDVLNARDTRNRMQLDSEMVNIPTVAARADFDLGIAVLGIVAQPFFIPDHSSIYGTNWALVQPDAPRYVRKFFGTYGQDHSPSEIEGALISQKASDGAFEGASIGASMRFHFGSFDASYYYHFGRDRSPFVYLDPRVAQQIDTLKSDSNPTGKDFDLFYAAQKEAAASYGGPLVVESIQRHHVGTDLTTTSGPFVLRGDAAFDTAATFYARDTLNSVARPTATVVAGMEYQGGFGKVIVLEASYLRLLGPKVPVVPVADQNNSGPLLFVKDDNVGIANVIRCTFFDYLVFEARSFIGLTPLSWVIRPEIGYQSSSYTIRVGYLAIDGQGGSFGSYYRRNESVYVTTRYSF